MEENEECLAQRRRGAKEAVRMLQFFPPLFWTVYFWVKMEENCGWTRVIEEVIKRGTEWNEPERSGDSRANTSSYQTRQIDLSESKAPQGDRQRAGSIAEEWVVRWKRRGFSTRRRGDAEGRVLWVEEGSV